MTVLCSSKAHRACARWVSPARASAQISNVVRDENMVRTESAEAKIYGLCDTKKQNEQKGDASLIDRKRDSAYWPVRLAELGRSLVRCEKIRAKRKERSIASFTEAGDIGRATRAQGRSRAGAGEGGVTFSTGKEHPSMVFVAKIKRGFARRRGSQMDYHHL